MKILKIFRLFYFFYQICKKNFAKILQISKQTLFQYVFVLTKIFLIVSFCCLFFKEVPGEKK